MSLLSSFAVLPYLISSKHRWKGYESSLTLVGAVSSELLEHIQESSEMGTPMPFDLGHVFTAIIPSYLAASGVSPSLLSFFRSLTKACDSQRSHSFKGEVSFSPVNSLEPYLSNWRISILIQPYKCSRIQQLEFRSKYQPSEH